MFSQTVEYALRAMTCLAGQPDRPATAEQIGQVTQVPVRYLSKIMRDMVVAELVDSQRGPNGGFSLRREPSLITILDVVNAVDPVRRIERCPLGNPAHIKLCPLHQRLDDAIALIEKALGDSTLAEVIEDARGRPGRCRVLAGPSGTSVKISAPKAGGSSR